MSIGYRDVRVLLGMGVTALFLFACGGEEAPVDEEPEEEVEPPLPDETQPIALDPLLIAARAPLDRGADQPDRAGPHLR